MSLRDILPEAFVIEKASTLEIEDTTGAKVQFGTLFGEQKTIVVFIRHFFCGSCQAYAAQLSEVPEVALSSAGTRIVLIGCGEWKMIEAYKDMTGFRGLIYADPSRELFHTLGMDMLNTAIAPSGEQRRSYLTQSIVGIVLSGMMRILARPWLIGKQGPSNQNGGDFVFGPGNQCSFAHRMQHTQDHVEVVDLMEAAGVVFSK